MKRNNNFYAVGKALLASYIDMGEKKKENKIMNASFSAITKKARAAIMAHGGTIEPDKYYPNSLERVQVNAELVSSSDRAAWGNLSVEVWKLSDNNFLVWDSDDRELQFSSHS